jgi:regulation of enolase protein 1 (concanavalin A-like superfamily)
MTWVNQPRQWYRDGRDLRVHTEPFSDFWRTTALGYDHDSGHAFLAREQGDLAAEATVRADFLAAHDEAGLMIRLDARHWIKVGLQLVGESLAAVVVSTRDTSDMSGTALPDLPLDGSVRFRLEREGNAVRVLARPDRAPWQQLRLAHFPAGVPVGVGPMACSPHRGGLEAHFTDCDIETGRPSWAWPG